MCRWSAHARYHPMGYRPSEEFEQQIEASGSAESRSATMVFFENKENDERGSTGLIASGEARPPITRSSASTRTDLPEPVSPVSTLSPG